MVSVRTPPSTNPPLGYMKSLILQQFRPLHSGALCEQWLAIKQTGTVAEFRRTFIELAAPLEHIPENMLLAHFVNGLKEEIHAEVRMMGLFTLEQAMDLALKVEEKHRVQSFKAARGAAYTSVRNTSIFQLAEGQKSSSPSSYSSGSQGFAKSEAGSVTPNSWSPSHRSSSQSSHTSNHLLPPIPLAKPIGAVKKLTPKELQKKRERGLCFKCDEK